MCKSEIYQEFFVKHETGQTTQNRLRTKPTSLLHFDQTAWNPLQCVESFIPRVCIVSHSNANAKRPSHCLMLGCWMASIEKQRANGIERDSERNRKVGAWDKVYRPQTLLVINRFSPALRANFHGFIEAHQLTDYSPPQDDSHDDDHQTETAHANGRDDREVVVVVDESLPLRRLDVLAVWLKVDLKIIQKIFVKQRSRIQIARLTVFGVIDSPICNFVGLKMLNDAAWTLTSYTSFSVRLGIRSCESLFES